MPSIIKWEYQNTINIKATDQNGTAVKTWTSSTSSGLSPNTHVISCGPPVYEQLVIQREDVNLNQQPRIVGYRASVGIVLMTLGAKFQSNPMNIGMSDLEDVLAVLTSASYPNASLWLALHTTDYKRVMLRGGWAPQKLGGKNVGLVVTLNFVALDWQRTLPKVDGSQW